MTKVLVVEDNANLAFGLTRSLESEGYEVEAAEDGLRGFELARSTIRISSCWISCFREWTATRSSRSFVRKGRTFPF